MSSQAASVQRERVFNILPLPVPIAQPHLPLRPPVYSACGWEKALKPYCICKVYSIRAALRRKSECVWGDSENWRDSKSKYPKLGTICIHYVFFIPLHFFNVSIEQSMHRACRPAAQLCTRPLACSL